MSLSSRIRGWFRRWRRQRASRTQKAALREFVYLDEVSVYSLIASRLGPVASEFTETETASLQAELTGTLTGGLSVVKGELKSRAMDTQTRGTQVVRKSMVQTTFKELYEFEEGSLALRPPLANLKRPKIAGLSQIRDEMQLLASDGWIVDPGMLSRGKLFEVEVQLEAEAIFRVSAVASALLDMVQDNQEMFGSVTTSDIGTVRSVDSILAKLLVGLVPVRGLAVDYQVATIGDKEWIVHRRLLSDMPDAESIPTRPLFVVGVTEQSLFWKDIRRVLFSKSHFRVLCRLAQDGLQTNWTPVKLSHVLESVAPEIATQIDMAGSGALAAVTQASKSQGGEDQSQKLMHGALVRYGTSLAGHYGHSITADQLVTQSLALIYPRNSCGSVVERRRAFEKVTAELAERFQFAPEPVVAAQYRTEALMEVGLFFPSDSKPLGAGPAIPFVPKPDQRFLDSEFVAIYW